ncbi:MAG TPA: hypothetical protein VF624_07310 [Tepidisphaeraceae bacterium]|jgi:hypothetical protein
MCAKVAGVKVLVVDDEPDARALVKRLLEDCKAVVAGFQMHVSKPLEPAELITMVASLTGRA